MNSDIRKILKITQSGDITISNFNQNQYLFCIFFLSIRRNISNSNVKISAQIENKYEGVFFNFNNRYKLEIKRIILNLDRFATISIL
jgi:hypothetical protein